MPYRGHVKNGVVVLDKGPSLAEGTAVTVEPAEPAHPARAQWLLELAGLFPPADLTEIEDAVRDCRKVDPDGW